MRYLLTAAILASLALPVAAEDKSATAPALVPTIKQSPAAMRQTELDRLFAQLHAEGAEQKAQSVEKKIWANWGRNDSITAELLLGQATRAMDAQEFQTAEDILNRLIADKPDYSEAWNRRATLHFLARRYAKSLADIEMVLELEPRHFGALSGRGMVLEAMDRPNEALDAYREALSVNPYMAGVQAKVKQLEKLRPDI